MMNNHNDFILTRITYVLEEMISAINPICNVNGIGIETHPLFEYIMQSTFMKMCGAQEQKMKCILWELANNDFEFRYTFLNGNSSKNTYSSYDDKNETYKHLINQITKVDDNFDITKEEFFDKKKLTSENIISKLLKNSKLILIHPKKYNNFLDIWEKNFQSKEAQFIYKENKNKDKNDLLDGRKKEYGKFIGEFKLRDIYTEYLYKNRNRIAHNTKSYQHNLPSLNSLRDENYKYENYFVWFALLVLIDDIFIELYKKYLETLDQRKFL